MLSDLIKSVTSVDILKGYICCWHYSESVTFVFCSYLKHIIYFWFRLLLFPIENNTYVDSSYLNSYICCRFSFEALHMLLVY